MNPAEIAILTGIGLAAGFLGGLAGIGGSLIMLPALVIYYQSGDPERYHAFMASAMLVNIAVSLPAAIRHHKSGAVRMDVVKILLPVMAVTILGGVVVSNFDSQSRILQLLLALFIAVYCVINLARFFRKASEPAPEAERTTTGWLAGIGGVTGFIAGLLGIGGGIVMVPMLQVFTRLPIRQAIGTSSAVMCLTALVGALLKIATLAPHGQSPTDAALLAFTMAPGAIVGAWVGARVMHALPLQAVRVAISLLLLVASAKLAESALMSDDGGASPFAGAETE